MYALELPAQILQMTLLTGWNLGDVRVTQGVVDCCDSSCFDLDGFLSRHMAGDYGLVGEDAEDNRKTTASRIEGRTFTSLFQLRSDCLKVVTYSGHATTVVCLSSED